MADHATPQADQFLDRVPIRDILTRPDGGAGLSGQQVRVGGWVKAGTEEGKGTFALLELNDGSCPANLQVTVDAAVADLSPLLATGTCVAVDGLLRVPPEGTKQKIELRVEKVLHVGPVDPATFPIPKTKLRLEFLRDRIHFRPRTNTISAVARIRNALAFTAHSFLQEHGFLFVHTPFITTSDCEGAGEMLQATTLTSDAQKLEELIENLPPSEAAKVLGKVKAAAHPFFQEHGFLYGHTPFSTTSDYEEAGKMFQATTLICDAQKLEELIKNLPPSEAAKVLGKVKAAAHPFSQEHGFLYGHTPFSTTSDYEETGKMFQATTLISDAQKLEELIKNLPPSEAAKVLVKVRIAMVGKYTGLSDSYLSVLKEGELNGKSIPIMLAQQSMYPRPSDVNKYIVRGGGGLSHLLPDAGIELIERIDWESQKGELYGKSCPIFLAQPFMDPWLSAALDVNKVRIAMVGKYTGLSDSYLSVLKKRKLEEWEVSTGQLREDHMHVSEKFKEIECQYARLSEETDLISQQIKGTKLRLILLSKISQARECKDFVKARKLTNRLRDLIASQNEKERAIKMARTSTKD